MAKLKEPIVVYSAKNRKSISPKQTLFNVLQQMYDNVTYDDMMYEIYLLQKVECGLKEIEEGNILSNEDVKKRLRKWLN
ncbi:MAG: hypothetical protein KGZ58_09985 [Ignavibacteriales bacterium]|nr:hypothetical protein [Ignavibacteriales bacterium]